MIVTTDNIPRNYEQLTKMLRDNGSLSVDFKIKNKRKLKSAFDNIIAFEKSRRQKNNFSGKVKYLFITIANFYYQVLAGYNDRGLSLAITIFTILWPQLETYHGEDVDDEIARVTFYART